MFIAYDGFRGNPYPHSSDIEFELRLIALDGWIKQVPGD